MGPTRTDARQVRRVLHQATDPLKTLVTKTNPSWTGGDSTEYILIGVRTTISGWKIIAIASYSATLSGQDGSCSRYLLHGQIESSHSLRSRTLRRDTYTECLSRDVRVR
jgi:hypothetical protein